MFKFRFTSVGRLLCLFSCCLVFYRLLVYSLVDGLCWMVLCMLVSYCLWVSLSFGS